MTQNTASLAGRSPRSRLSPKFTLRLTQIGFLLLALGAWEAATGSGAINKIFLPSPGNVAQKAATIFPTHAFLVDLATTIGSVIVAYGCAVLAGVGSGALIGRNRFAYEVVEPILSSLFAIPLIIFFPLILLVAGIGPASKIAFAGLYGFFPIALSTMSGCVAVDNRYLLYARTLGASRWLLARRILIPAALPQIISGLRIGFVVTFASVVAGEMIASLAGLGHAITYYSQIMDSAKMFAVIGVVIFLTWVMNSLLTLLARTGERM